MPPKTGLGIDFDSYFPQPKVPYNPNYKATGFDKFKTDLEADKAAGVNPNMQYSNAGMDLGEGLGLGLDVAKLGLGGYQAYLAKKNYDLAKDQFGFEKAATNRNIANQASLVNRDIQNRGEVGLSLAGNTMNPEQRAARLAELESQKLSTAPIG